MGPVPGQPGQIKNVKKEGRLMEIFKVKGADGLELHGYQWLPTGEVKAVVQIAHGMSEHGGRYQRFAQLLNDAGYAVIAHDHRGHGLSVPEGQAPGHMADTDPWSKALQDLYWVNRQIAARLPGKKIILLGHSMGSFLAQDYMAQYGDSMAAVALSATNGPPGLLVRVGQLLAHLEKLRLGEKGHSPLILAMVFGAYNKAFKPNRTQFDWLSRDEAEVDKYVRDPLCGFECSVSTWIGMLRALRVIATDTAFGKMDKSKAIYVFAGTDDPVGEKSKGVKRLLAAYQKHAFSAVSHRFYAGGRHEMLNETNRNEVMVDFVAWADSIV
jgi:alpha-beta hydrolase superfamily lysophospholipase